MRRCTPAGSKDLSALPRSELFELKTIIFRNLSGRKSAAEFELLWKNKCWVAIEQACRRLRRK